MKDLQKMYVELMSSNSKLNKLSILKKYPENKKILFYIYHPQYTYGITSTVLRKNAQLVDSNSSHSIFSLLDALRTRELTGHDAIKAANAFIQKNIEYEDLIYKIIDRNLKASIGVVEINKVWPKLIPQFKVQLADLYITEQVAENSKKLKKTLKATKINFDKEVWFSSRKMDGLRCITVFDENGNATCFSRQGKEFLSLDVLKKAFEDIPVRLRKNRVLDGELCIIDEQEKEDYKSIMKVARKKDFTIPNPHYKLFDYLTVSEFNDNKGTEIFSSRFSKLQLLQQFVDTKFITLLEQIKIESRQHFDQLSKAAVNNGWEGLILRKDVAYSAKRSKNMLKFKPFFDAEFEVLAIEHTTKNMLNKEGVMVPVECMGYVIIPFKTSQVRVGSGWTDEERILYGNHPELLIGKEITVAYTEESEDENGNPSLRFPRKKIVHNGKRDT